MKNSSPKSSFRGIASKIELNTLEDIRQKPNFHSKACKKTMTNQLIAPPARVWEKIEKILDEQDNRVKNANALIASSFDRNKNKLKRAYFYFATVAGVSLVAGLLLIKL